MRAEVLFAEIVQLAEGRRRCLRCGEDKTGQEAVKFVFFWIGWTVFSRFRRRRRRVGHEPRTARYEYRVRAGLRASAVRVRRRSGRRVYRVQEAVAFAAQEELVQGGRKIE